MTHHPNNIAGVTYNSALPPSRKIEGFLSALDKCKGLKEQTDEFQTAIDHVKMLAEVWFEDEVAIIKLRKQ